MLLDVLSTRGGVYIGGASSEEELDGIGEGVEVKVTSLEVLRTGGGV